MRIYTILFLIAVLSSCETDRLAPCEEGLGSVGNVCRQYRFADERSIGYIDYIYEADSLRRESYFDEDVRLRKTVTYRYENGRISSIAEQFPNQATRVQTWHYNEMDSLWQVVYGSNDSIIQITYVDGKRKEQRFFHNGQLNRSLEYRYFQDDGKLYRVSYFNDNDSLLSYRNHEYFSTGQQRVSHYTSDHALIGRRVYRFSQLGLITSNEFTNSEGVVTYREDYIYDIAGKLVESNKTDRGQTSKNVYLYY